MIISNVFAVLSSALTIVAASPQLQPSYQGLPSLREQADIQNAWRTERVANIPSILRKHGVDAWLMTQREYAEDTAFWSIKCATDFSARRRTVHLFFADAAEGLQTAYKFVDNTLGVFDDLRDVLDQHQPKTIALNVDPAIAFAGGLHVGLFAEIDEQLGLRWSERFVSVPLVAVEYVATLPSSQLTWYRRLQETTWALIGEAFSSSVITPGVTTTTDVEWWLREKVQSLNHSTWFQPDVTIVTANEEFGPIPPGIQCTDGGAPTKVIHGGDMLHVDFGVTALGLNTDTQHLAYVVRSDGTSSDVPKGMLEGLEKVNRLQDIVRHNMIIGKTGNEILNASLTQMRSEGLEGKIYCHAIGDWGHSAGTLIGMTNLQDGVPVLGDLPLLEQTYYSVELYAEHFVPERNETLNFYQEEDVFWVDGDRWEWVYGRQDNFLVIDSSNGGEGDLVVQA